MSDYIFAAVGSMVDTRGNREARGLFLEEESLRNVGVLPLPKC